MTEFTGVCNQDIVCILGMHRSGTSLLTRMLNLIGVYLGPEQLLMHPNFANPRGFWEHDEIVSLNDEILRRLGGIWAEPPDIPTRLGKRSDDRRPETARAKIDSRFVR